MSAIRKLHIIEIIMGINNESLLMAMEREVLRLQQQAHQALSATALPNTDAMYQGSGLDGSIETMRYDELSQHTDLAYTPNAAGLSQTLAVLGGAWEDDESESIESLLTMLQ
jgi:hypothetical protein